MQMKKPMISAEVSEKPLGNGFKLLGVLALLFGLLTIREGSAVIFFDGPGKAAAGNYVPFVLIFNTIAGVFYVVAGVGVLRRRRWAKLLAIFLAGSTAVVFAALGVFVFLGNPYEMRTIGAMVLRTAFWGFAAVALQRGAPMGADS